MAFPEKKAPPEETSFARLDRFFPNTGAWSTLSSDNVGSEEADFGPSMGTALGCIGSVVASGFAQGFALNKDVWEKHPRNLPAGRLRAELLCPQSFRRFFCALEKTISFAASTARGAKAK